MINDQGDGECPFGFCRLVIIWDLLFESWDSASGLRLQFTASSMV